MDIGGVHTCIKWQSGRRATDFRGVDTFGSPGPVIKMTKRKGTT